MDEAEETFRWVKDSYFAQKMRREMLDKVEYHRSRGDRVVLLSGMFQEFLDLVGKDIGAAYVIGTRLEIKKGICTGRIIQPLCFGENKSRLLRERMQSLDLEVDWEGSTAYADSYFDLPVFKLVGHPVAAYPDAKLARIAEGGGWPIIGAPHRPPSPNNRPARARLAML